METNFYTNKNMDQTASAETTWNALVLHKISLTNSLKDFLAKDIDRISIIRAALKTPERDVALYAAGYLQVRELLLLFPDLIDLASRMHSSIHIVRNLVLTLPRDYVLENIEVEIKHILDKNDSGYDEYRRLLELCFKLDRDLTLKLAYRAVQHTDPDVQDAGNDFLNKIRLVDDNSEA